MNLLNINQQPPKNSFKINSKPSNFTSCKPKELAFKGHLGSKTIFKNGSRIFLRHQTSLFRDIKTKHFVRDYVLKNFQNKPEIKIVVGGCASGEEVFTFSMLLKSLGSRLRVDGFDLSKKSIEQAKTGKILMQKLTGAFTHLKGLCLYEHDDAFLCFPTGDVLTEAQAEQKKLFDEFFELTDEIYKEKQPISQRFGRWFYTKVLRMPLPTYESKIVKIKEGKFGNCDFQVGDFLELDKMLGGKKADVITFTNALYHLTTTETAGGVLRKPKENAEQIVRMIATSLRKNLNDRGIFVLGEREFEQTFDSSTVPKVFQSLGFRPLNKTPYHSENVWQLVK